MLYRNVAREPLSEVGIRSNFPRGNFFHLPLRSLCGSDSFWLLKKNKYMHKIAWFVGILLRQGCHSRSHLERPFYEVTGPEKTSIIKYRYN